MAKAKAGPVVTDNGNLLLDWTFNISELREKLGVTPDKDLWQAVNEQLCCLAGVVDTGLFVQMAKVCYFGDSQGNVITKGQWSSCLRIPQIHLFLYDCICTYYSNGNKNH